MELYFIDRIAGETVRLDGEQFRHACKVMRKRSGDRIMLTDGQGKRAIATISEVGKRSAEVRIDKLSTMPRANYHIDVAVALTKNSKRIEWALEKMAELGVRSVTPINCAHSERTRINSERIKKILIAAIKQSQQFYVPEISEPITFLSFIKNHPSGFEGLRCIAHLSNDSQPLRHNYRAGQNVVIVIGPEGDFSEEEVDIAIRAGFTEVSLGRNRLRTETAAVAAVTYIHALND